jgi:hypothetical protein
MILTILSGACADEVLATYIVEGLRTDFALGTDDNRIEARRLQDLANAFSLRVKQLSPYLNFNRPAMESSRLHSSSVRH